MEEISDSKEDNIEPRPENNAEENKSDASGIRHFVFQYIDTDKLGPVSDCKN